MAAAGAPAHGVDRYAGARPFQVQHLAEGVGGLLVRLAYGGAGTRPPSSRGAHPQSRTLLVLAQIVAPPTFVGELVKLDKGPAIVAMQNKHNLRPFMLDVYKASF